MKLSTPTLASHRAGTRTAILGIVLSWVLWAPGAQTQGARRFHPDVDAFNLRVGTQTFAGRLPDDAEFATLTAPLLNRAPPEDSSARLGDLEIAIRPGSEAGALNVRSPHCPDDLFDFRTCEGVVVGSTDLGLFQVKLPATFGDGHRSWRRDGNTWSYVWPYAQGITVRVAVEPDTDSLKLHYTLQNTGAQAFDAVQLHTCIPTTEAPGFFPPPTVRQAETNWSELYQRLHLWSDGRRFTLAETTLAGREPHLSLMRQGAAPVRWAWWVNGPETFDLPLIALTSRDEHKTIALAFEQAVWASANTGDDRACFHLFPWFGRIEPGQSVSVRGRFYLLRGGREAALARFHQDFPGGATVNWSQFRGPNGAGVAESFRPPLKVALAEAAWKTALPPGSSSPVLWGNRVFVTGVEGNRLVTIGLDATSGDVLWKRLAPETPLERVHDASNPAASTPCADADQVYVYFGSYGLLCYDHDGGERWSKPIPTPQNMYGVATSPLLHQDLLILVRDDDADLPDSRLSRSSVIALNRKTGEPIWETSRPYNRGAWATPMTKTASGRKRSSRPTCPWDTAGPTWRRSCRVDQATSRTPMSPGIYAAEYPRSPPRFFTRAGSTWSGTAAS
ncbi:MAG: PQQ-binding-like beta-propeller repeat protein [Verrucomicrobia bacterium]|nr:PQQ-binding-like beta-propeller repeat protein [Verrucomicrobiota bacterium]